MSTTAALKVAVEYSASAASVLLRLRTASFMARGADIAFLSAFPAEQEFVYPPLTYLEPTGGMETITIEKGAAGPDSPHISITIIEVQPKMT